MEIGLSHRILWPNFPGKFNTDKFSADFDISCIRGLGGIGIMLSSNVEGNGYLKTISIGIPFAVRIRLSEKSIIQPGVQISLINKTIKWDEYVFRDQFDQVLGIVRPSSFSVPAVTKKVFPDFSLGLIWEWQNNPEQRAQVKNTSIRIGIAGHHITQPDFSFTGMSSKLPIKLVGHVNGNFPLEFDNTFVISPAVIYEYQKPMHTFLIGSNFLWKYPFLGLWMRGGKNLDAIIFAAGVKIGAAHRFYLSYSYDMTLSKLSNVSGGSHEINLVYMGGKSLCGDKRKGNKNHYKDRKRILICPEF